MQSTYLIGVDIGTGSTKAVAVDRNNNVLQSAQNYYTSIASGDRSEQDVQVVYKAFLQTVRELIAAIGEQPAGISLSSAMHSVLAVDAEGGPLTPAVLWSDTRSSQVAEALRSAPIGKELYLATGTPLHSMSPLCKIRWWSENEPSLLAQAAKFISIKEYIWNQLFGEYEVDHSIASATGLFNIHQRQWEPKALKFAGLHASQLSTPVSVYHQRLIDNKEVMAELGLRSSIPVVIGASDGALANLGSYCFSASDAAITIGTSAAVRITSQQPVQDFARMIFSYVLDDENFVCGGAINNGGNTFQWLLQKIFVQHKEVSGYEQMFETINGVAPGSGGLLFLPYLHGERAPVWDEKSSGAFVGLHAGHGLPELARATAEGVCFALRDVLHSLEEACGQIQQITVSGGLVREASIMQLLANVTGKKIMVEQREDASAVGAAMIGQKALGWVKSYPIAEARASIYVPEALVVKDYERLFPIYQNLYPTLKQQMHLLQSLY